MQEQRCRRNLVPRPRRGIRLLHPLPFRDILAGETGMLAAVPGSSRSSPGSTKEAPLVLPVHGMRLHIHPFEGSGDGLCGSHHRAKEPITVTPAEIIYQRRIAVLDYAARVGNVAEACRVFGISRTRYYEWKGVADPYRSEERR